MEHDDWCCDLRVNEYTALNIAVRQPLRGRRQQSVGQIVQPIPRRAQPQDAAGLGLEAERCFFRLLGQRFHSAEAEPV